MFNAISFIHDAYRYRRYGLTKQAFNFLTEKLHQARKRYDRVRFSKHDVSGMNKAEFILTEYAAFDLHFLMFSSLTILLAAGNVATNALSKKFDSVSGVVETFDF